MSSILEKVEYAMILVKNWFIWVEVFISMKKNQKSREPKKKQARSQKKFISFLDEFKSEIAAFFEINNEQPFELQQLHDHFDADDQKLRLIFNGLLDELIEEGRIKRTEEGLYTANVSANVLIWRV